MTKNCWKKVVALVLSLLLGLPGTVLADSVSGLEPFRNGSYDAEMLSEALALLSNGYMLHEDGADEPIIKMAGDKLAEYAGGEVPTLGVDSAEKSGWHYIGSSTTGWGASESASYLFEESGLDQAAASEMLALIELGTNLSGKQGDGLDITLNGGEEGVTLPIGSQTEDIAAFMYATGNAQDPCIVAGLVQEDGFASGVIIGWDESGEALEFKLQYVVVNGQIILNANYPAAKVDPDGNISFYEKGETSLIIISESGIAGYSFAWDGNELSHPEVTSEAAESDAVNCDEMSKALHLMALCSIQDGCGDCGEKYLHLLADCSVHCSKQEGDHAACELCGAHMCDDQKHGEGEGECSYVANPTAAPSRLPTVAPTSAPAVTPTSAPTAAPTEAPTPVPTAAPSEQPSDIRCGSCSAVVGNADEHKRDCGHFECAADFALIDHGSCGCCGMYVCQDGYVRSEHAVCTSCGMSKCDDGYVAADHDQCPGCGMYACKTGYEDLEHSTDACGHYKCMTGYANFDHRLFDCGEHYSCSGDSEEKHETICPLCGGYKCREYISHISDTCYCWRPHYGSSSFRVIGSEGAGAHVYKYCYECGAEYCAFGAGDWHKMETCSGCGEEYCVNAGGHGAAGCGNPDHYNCDGLDHGAAGCGEAGHYNCDGSVHERCPGFPGCPAYQCRDYYRPEWHVQCPGCHIYSCNSVYRLINHDQCPGCGKYACENGYVAADHDQCPGCGKYACMTGYANFDHSAAECGAENHFNCDGDVHEECPGSGCTDYQCKEGYDHRLFDCGEHYSCSGDSEEKHDWFCQVCGGYRCRRYIFHTEFACDCSLQHYDRAGSTASIRSERAVAHVRMFCNECEAEYCAFGAGDWHKMETCGGCGKEYCVNAGGHGAAGCGNPDHYNCDGDHGAAECGKPDHYNCDGEDHGVAICGIAGHYKCDENDHGAAACQTEGHYKCDEDDHGVAICGIADHYKCDEDDEDNHGAAGCGMDGHYKCDGLDHSMC